MIRTVSLYYYLPRTSASSRTARRLCQELECTFSGTVIIRIQRHICRQNTDQRHIWKIMSFYDHLCPDHDICFFVCEFRQDFLMSAFVLRGIHVHPKNPCLWEFPLHQIFNLLCSRPETSDIRRPAHRTILNSLCLIPTVMTDHFSAPVYRQ